MVLMCLSNNLGSMISCDSIAVAILYIVDSKSSECALYCV